MMRYPDYLERPFDFPDFFRVKIHPPDHSLADPVEELKSALLPALDQANVLPGQTVAVGVGSRGIANIRQFMACICQCIREKGARPRIIPCMGSHGGATPEGQVRVLERLGALPEGTEADICPEMNVNKISEVFDQVPVYFSSKALEAEHTICINRIKPHTKFKGPMESGLYKMLVVGMGKYQGALVYHRMALKYGFYRLLRAMGDEIVARTNFCLGIGIVEDQLDRTLAVAVIPAREIARKEPLLLDRARAVFPDLPFDSVDALIIQQIGKEISGAGMDPNVTGRTCDFMEDDFSGSLRAGRVVILNLSPETAGNAIGLGNADIITEKVFQDMDYEATLMNALTAMSLRKAFIPVRLPTEEKAIQAAFQTLGPLDPSRVRAVILEDTRHTMDFLVSRALRKEARSIPYARIGQKILLEFSPDGSLLPLF